MSRPLRCLIAALLCLNLGPLLAAEQTGQTLRLAVASNFASAMAALKTQYQNQIGDSLLISLGATSKHAIQIQHGAPYDIFLSADAQHPKQLAERGFAIGSSRTTYAIGQLALWQPHTALPPFSKPTALQQHLSAHTGRVAIANPALAPYGLAAQQLLTSLGLADTLTPQLIRGENIGQAYQYVASGAVPLGIVALTQVLDENPTHVWKISSEYHQAIEQQVILLKDNPATQRFLGFLLSPAAKLIIRQHGYLTP